MSASSLTVAAAVIGACSNFLISSTPIDHHRSLSLYLVPFKAKPIKAPHRLIHSLSYPPISLSSIFHASTAFENVGLSEKEEDPESRAKDDVVQAAEGDGRLYVGNLLFSITSAQLSEIFAEADRVASVEQIGGRTANVNFPEVPRGGEREVMRPKIRSSYLSSYKIYAGNLSWNLTSQTLREVFAEQPGFLSAKVIFDRESGRSRGFGFITFSSAEEVDSALTSLNGLEVEGWPLRLNLSEQKPAASPVKSMLEIGLESSEVFSGASA